MRPMPLAVLLIAVITLACAAALRSQSFDGMKLKAAIDLPGVEGRIDHMAIDRKTQRVFVAALGNNTVEVVDLGRGKHARSLKGFAEPQGVLFLGDANRLFVTNGEDGTCRALDGTSLKELGKISGLGDADNIRFDSLAHMVYVGYGSGGLAMIDPAALKISATLPLSEHPESFQIDNGSNAIFINVPNEKKIVVYDKVKKQKLSDWTLKEAERNYPMALDKQHHRLFVGCRTPSRMLVFDTQKGAITASVPIGSDTDDIFYDAERHRLYVSCGEGVVDVFSVESPDHLKQIGTVPTRKGARTSLFIPDMKLYIVAAPKAGTKGAQLLVFTVN